MILSSDSEKVIRMEAAYNMRYICQELDENFIKRNLLKTIESYVNDDDSIIKTEVFISIIWNFKKFQDESVINFINNYIQKINMFFDNSNEFTLLTKIFYSIIEEYFDKLASYNLSNRNFYNLVKTFLKVKFLIIINSFIIQKKFVINNETNEPESIEFIIKVYENVCKIIEHHKETHILYEILNYIILRTDKNDDNNFLFFSNFDKVFNIINKFFILKFIFRLII